MNKRSSKSENHNNGSVGTGSVLSRLTIEDLKVIKVSICRRSYVPGTAETVPIERNLGDPASLLVHRSGEGKHSLFARNDIAINVEEHTEKRTVLKSPRRSRSISIHSRERYSRSPRQRSSSKSPTKYPRRNESKQNEYVRNVESSTAEKADEYGSSEKKSHGGDAAHYKSSRYEMYKERSPRPSTSKKDYERSSKEGRDGDIYRKSTRESPRGYDKNRTPSPRKYKYTSDKEKYARQSQSPRSRKHSRSPYPRRSYSPTHSKRRSRSPQYRRSPRDDRGTVSSSTVKTVGRRSDSYEKSHIKRRSISPYSRRHSRSPHGSRRRSRSPAPRHSESRRRNSSRSPSKRVYKHSHPEREYIDYPFFGAEGYWIPGPIPRPGFVPRGAIASPMFIPRGAPYMVPRPYLPIHQFRPRFPYHQSYRHRFTTSSTTTTEATPTSTTTTITIAAGSGSNSTQNPIIEEVQSDPEKADSTSVVKK